MEAEKRSEPKARLVDPRSQRVSEAEKLRVITALRSRGAHVLPHARWSLLSHLIGTFDILHRWEQPANVRVAGLAHSVYSTDKYRNRLFGFQERREVAAIVGEAAERLVYLFCALPRDQIFRLASTHSSGSQDVFRVQDRLSKRLFVITAQDLRDIVVIHAANIAEQAASKNGAPRSWLSNASRILSFARPFPFAPPVFGGCESRLDDDQESALLDAYHRAWTSKESSSDLEVTFRNAPWVGEPFALLGLRALAAGDVDVASSCGIAAREKIHSWASPWDKRLSTSQWLTLALFLQGCRGLSGRERAFVADQIGRILETADDPARLIGRLTAIGLQQLGPGVTAQPTTPAPAVADAALPKRFAEYVNGFRDNAKKPRMGIYPGLRANPFWDAREFPLAMELERLAPLIIEEFRGIPRDAFHGESERIKRVGAWDVFLLFERGKKRTDRCALVPETVRIVENHRVILTMNGLVYFSRIAPNSRIARHRGPTNLRLRCHLGIDVPTECGIRVGGETRTWETGKCLVFDDSFPHEAWNDSNSERIVLIVDLWHPDLQDSEIELLAGLDRRVQYAAHNLDRYRMNNERASEARRTDCDDDVAMSLVKAAKS